MTTEAQRIAIAEVCGWTKRKRIFHNENWKDVETWFAPQFKDWPEDSCPAGMMVGAYPPDYLHDLNAMHDAEKTLNEVDRVTYFRQLETIVDRDVGRVIAFAVGDATAAQRAEAFLRMKGLWK